MPIVARHADPKGKANWVKYLDANMTIDVVINSFTDSIKYSVVCSNYGIKKA